MTKIQKWSINALDRTARYITVLRKILQPTQSQKTPKTLKISIWYENVLSKDPALPQLCWVLHFGKVFFFFFRVVTFSLVLPLLLSFLRFFKNTLHTKYAKFLLIALWVKNTILDLSNCRLWLWLKTWNQIMLFVCFCLKSQNALRYD